MATAHRPHRESPLRGALLRAAVAVSLAGCTAPARPLGEECLYNDDCVEETLCAARRCRAICRDERDCPTGWRCAALAQGGRSVCVATDHPDFCQYHSQCPQPQACGYDGLCRYQCREARDCGDFNAGLRCDLDAGVCLWPQESAGAAP